MKLAYINTDPSCPTMDKPWSWVTLLFSLFYFFSFFFMPLTPQFVLVSVLLYTAYLALCLQLTNCPKEKVLQYIIALILLGFFGSSQNPSSSIFFGYGAFFAGFYLNRLLVLFFGLLICATILLTALVFDLFYSYYLFPAIVPAISMACLGLFVQVTDKHTIRERQNAEEKRQLAKVAERERIARDLHDTLGHSLSSIALKAQLAKKLGDRGDTQAALHEIHQVAKLASSTLTEVREAVSGYRKRGLPEHLELLQSRLEDAGFKTHISCEALNLNAANEASLIMMLTEAVTNIIRHSNGKLVDISLSKNENQLQALIRDNGVVDHFTPGNGLKGLEERLQEMNGSMQVSSEKGFCLHLNFSV